MEDNPLLINGSLDRREYQLNAAKEAVTQNTMIVMPTALGKTIIAALVAGYMLLNQRGKRVLMMAPTKPLCEQHKETFGRLFRFPNREFKLLTGMTHPKLRELAWKGDARLMFATPQVVQNDLSAGRIDLEQFALVIFDECHRAVKDYAYTEIARRYMESSSYPIILGLTASPGAMKERLKAISDSLFIERIIYKSEDDDDVKSYINPVTVEWKKVDLPLAYRPLMDLLGGMLDTRLKWLADYDFLRTKNVYRKQLLEAGDEIRRKLQSAGAKGKGFYFTAIQQQSIALTLFHMRELLTTQGAQTLIPFVERMGEDNKRAHSTIEADPMFRKFKELLYGPCNVEHPKVKTLISLIKAGATPASRVLVFTQYRDTASYLVSRLSKEGIKGERFVGQATKEADVGMSQEVQRQTLDAFKSGALNCLVATSIAEEGLDIPQVDMVIFYEPVPSEIRFIQRRGRTGRRMAGKVFILVANDTSDVAYMYSSIRKAAIMKKVIKNVNSILKPIQRRSPFFIPDPMTEDEIGSLPLSPDRSDDSSELQLELNRSAAESAGRVHGDKTDLRIGAVRRLGLDEQPEGPEAHAITTDMVIDENYGEPQLRKVSVLKVGRGFSIVKIDEKWITKLSAGNFNGPRGLIRKGGVFSALCQFFDENGVVNVIVSNVVQEQ